jgi:D-alanyl-lipoteichoic acid acyltransferase DltB (MBOAT superfamily)
MFKKVVIADRLALYVNGVYGEPAAYPAAALALATFFFAFQIYCDFSGYSDIAIGCARVLGFNLMTNFRRPYFSRSITEFWRRWHISLSTWLKDYLYIPLGGNRKGRFRQKLNLLITFLLSGLWHGAAWHFVAWGALHGLFQMAERCFRFSVTGCRNGCQLPVTGCRLVRYENTNSNADSGVSTDLPDTNLPTTHYSLLTKTLKPATVLITFALVCFAWIFFRANSMRDAFVIIAKLATLPAEMAGYIRQFPAAGILGTARTALQIGGAGILRCCISGILIVILIAADILAGKKAIIRKPLILRWAGDYALALTVLLSWNDGASQFIYFNF